MSIDIWLVLGRAALLFFMFAVTWVIVFFVAGKVEGDARIAIRIISTVAALIASAVTVWHSVAHAIALTP